MTSPSSGPLKSLVGCRIPVDRWVTITGVLIWAGGETKTKTYFECNENNMMMKTIKCKIVNFSFKMDQMNNGHSFHISVTTGQNWIGYTGEISHRQTVARGHTPTAKEQPRTRPRTHMHTWRGVEKQILPVPSTRSRAHTQHAPSFTQGEN